MDRSSSFSGHVRVEPALDAAEIAYLTRFADTRRMKRAGGPYFVRGTGICGQGFDADIEDYNEPPDGQPSLGCKWIPTEDGARIEWNGIEKFERPLEWMAYLIDHFLKPGAVAKTQTIDGREFFTFGDHTLDGAIEAYGEEGDRWLLVVRDNVATLSETEVA